MKKELSAPGRLLYRAYASTYLQLDRLHRLLADLPLVLSSPALERFGIDRSYQGSRKYQEPQNQEQGFFPFEETALKAYFPKPPAKILVPGAGGGREVLALSKLGYQVDGFEPVPQLLQAAKEITASSHGVRLWKATLQDWSKQAKGQYAGIMTGWGMWTHMLHQQERVEALQAFAKVCPTGPVLLSFWRDDYPSPLFPKPKNRLEKITRTWIRQTLLRKPPIERGTAWMSGMYVHFVSKHELTEESQMAGWRIAFYDGDPENYPNAVLLR